MSPLQKHFISMHCLNCSGKIDHRRQSEESQLEIWGFVSAVDRYERTIWIADAHRDNGKRLVQHADEKQTAFLELESAISTCIEFA
jgi:hypothetical protein